MLLEACDRVAPSHLISVFYALKFFLTSFILQSSRIFFEDLKFMVALKFLMLYANDYLLVACATLRDAVCLSRLLNAYSTFYGQSINFAKSHIIFTSCTNCTVQCQIIDFLHITEK